jgi:uncharacterized protein YbcI
MTDATAGKLSRGQLERTLSQRLQKLYREHLDHSTGKVSCQLINDKLTVIVEDSLTQPEKLLIETSKDPELVEKVRSDLDSVIRPKIIGLVEEILERKVLDLMSDTTLETGRTGVIVVLSNEP